MKDEGTSPLGDRLAEAIDGFDPFEALRLLDESGTPPDLTSALTNRYVATPLRPGRRPGEVETAFASLIGPLGTLPPFYTETALRERRRRSHGMRAFLDLFIGPLVRLFVRAHEKYRMPASVARHGVEGASPATAALYALVGLGFPALRDRLATADAELLPYAGLLARDTRSAAGLEVLLRHHLGLPVRIEPLQPRWIPIADHEQTRLGRDGHFLQLGVDAVAGTRTLDVSSTFRVVLGPVDYGTFQWLAPDSDAMAQLVELVRVYVDPGLDFDVQVVLRKEDVPEAQLGAAALRLGWNAWVREMPALADADEAVFEPSPAA